MHFTKKAVHQCNIVLQILNRFVMAALCNRGGHNIFAL